MNYYDIYKNTNTNKIKDNNQIQTNNIIYNFDDLFDEILEKSSKLNFNKNFDSIKDHFSLENIEIKYAEIIKITEIKSKKVILINNK